MNNPVIIFDFDGTIADTHQYLIEISNRLANEFKFKSISPHEIDLLKEKTSQEVIRHLNVPYTKIPRIIARAKKEFNKGIATVDPFPGIKEALILLKSAGVKIGILSSNTKDNIMRFLENHDLNLFDFIHTTSKIWSKNVSISKLMKKHNLPKERVIYVGDEIRDITAAKKLGIRIACVTWGYNSGEALKAYAPDYLIERPQDLIQLLSIKNG